MDDPPANFVDAKTVCSNMAVSSLTRSKGMQMIRPNLTIGMVLLLVSLGLILPQRGDAQDKSERKRGGAWPDVFISASSLGMYHVIFDQPVVEKGDMPKVY